VKIDYLLLVSALANVAFARHMPRRRLNLFPGDDASKL
jgi:hypothetical protein